MTKDVAELDVSVIIVSWNARDFLMQCLASLYSDEGRRVKEIIVVDNASTIDGSPDTVEARYPGVRLIRNPENSGFSKANNIGVRQCTGEYVCFMNSDAKTIGDCIGQLVDYCEEHRDVGMVGPRVNGWDGRIAAHMLGGFPVSGMLLAGRWLWTRSFPKVKSIQRL